MAKWALTTRRLWANLGLRDIEEPEVVYAVQPVYIVGDGSALIPPTLPPYAWAGAFFTPPGTDHGAFELQSLAPGGCMIKDLSASTPGQGQTWRWAIRTATASLPSSSTRYNMGPLPVQSLVTFGPVATPGALGGTDPHRNHQEADVLMLAPGGLETYIPAGSFFYMETAFDVANFCSFSVLFQDVPEASPASPT